MADGVDVLNSRYLADQLFHGNRGALSYFFSGCPWHLGEDIQHGNDNLRFFLARSFLNTKSPQQESAHDD